MNARNTHRAGVLLRLRQQAEDLAIQEFSHQKARIESLRCDIGRMHETIASQSRQVRDGISAQAVPGAAVDDAAGSDAQARQATRLRSTAAAMRELRDTTRRIGLAMAEHSEQLAAAQDSLRVRRDELVAARKSRKAMDKLVERLVAQQAGQLDRQETKDQDDLFATFQGQRSRMNT